MEYLFGSVIQRVRNAVNQSMQKDIANTSLEEGSDVVLTEEEEEEEETTDHPSRTSSTNVFQYLHVYAPAVIFRTVADTVRALLRHYSSQLPKMIGQGTSVRRITASEQCIRGRKRRRESAEDEQPRRIPRSVVSEESGIPNLSRLHIEPKTRPSSPAEASPYPSLFHLGVKRARVLEEGSDVEPQAVKKRLEGKNGWDRNTEKEGQQKV